MDNLDFKFDHFATCEVTSTEVVKTKTKPYTLQFDML